VLFRSPLLEEVLEVGKQVIETGKVKVTKRVVNETKEITIPLSNDELHIERIPCGHYVDSIPPPFRYEEDTVVIPILKEEYVKRIVLVEEVRITRRTISREYKQEVTLQREEVELTQERKVEPKD